MSKIIIFDCEGITIKNSNIAELTKIAWLVYDIEHKAILKEQAFDLNYNLYKFDKEKWINTYRWLKRNMPFSLTDNSPKFNGGASLKLAREEFMKDYNFFNVEFAYAKGLSNIDLTFVGPLPIKTRELTNDYNIPNYYGEHNPKDEIRFFCFNI